jgi:hypothetical protein
LATAHLHLERVSQWMSRWRKFRVVLDGQCIDKIRRGVTREYEIAPGEHELVVSIDWVASAPVRFRCEGGEHVRFVCGHPSPTWHVAANPGRLVSEIELVRVE